ncbi:MAG: hypothetical protein ACLFQK_08970 [Fibrobacterota bacterium]
MIELNLIKERQGTTGKSSGKLFVFILSVLLVSALGGLAVYYILDGGASASPEPESTGPGTFHHVIGGSSKSGKDADIVEDIIEDGRFSEMVTGKPERLHQYDNLAPSEKRVFGRVFVRYGLAILNDLARRYTSGGFGFRTMTLDLHNGFYFDAVAKRSPAISGFLSDADKNIHIYSIEKIKGKLSPVPPPYKFFAAKGRFSFNLIKMPYYGDKKAPEIKRYYMKSTVRLIKKAAVHEKIKIRKFIPGGYRKTSGSVKQVYLLEFTSKYEDMIDFFDKLYLLGIDINYKRVSINVISNNSVKCAADFYLYARN